MSKHTPGPWGLEDMYEGVDVDRLVISENGVLVADCWPPSAEDYGLPDEDEYRSNARLIAASPKLLDGLKSVLEILRNGQEVDAINDAHWIEMLIEEATGEAP